MDKPILNKIYEPKEVEDKIYQQWEQSGYFNPDNLPIKKNAKAFSISLPPPNVTGQLHIGHAVMLAIQDTLIRYHRMKGDKTLWLPGMDHAAIATQNVVEKELKNEDKTKEGLGRKEFLKRVEQYVDKSKGTIKKQITGLGASLDWSRERFTLDKGLSQAVKTAFIKMYEDELIYRGDRIVNWCPRCQSTLADDEVEYKEQSSSFYYFKYGPVIIGTARPETKFGDKVIIVHPDDKRYKDLVGQEFEVEWILGKIKAKVIADKAADPEMGTGAMTITPGHSFVDFELAKKYNIPIEKIIEKDGKLSQAAGQLAGLTAKEARAKVVEILEAKGLVDHIDEKYKHNLSVCYRCGTPIEPLVSRQWFVAVDKPTKQLNGKSLKQRAIEVIKKKEIEFIPSRFEKTYKHWMENLHDWCISRQLWYGHRIPIWYCNDCHKDPKRYSTGKYYWIVKDTEPKQCPFCKSKSIHQDNDTLDTWFSSGLWTFSTLGWPDKTKDLKTFHPTSVMETGYDIIFFWVARMIIMSTYLLKEVPFKSVYLHGLVRDKQGRKMSKSLGNGIDPLSMSDKYGADAVRLSLVIGTTPGNDLKLYEEKIAGYRNFTNKLWNIARYVTSQPKPKSNTPKPKTLSDKWILSRLNALIGSVSKDIEAFRLSDAGTKTYEFVWHEFADWYIEIHKIEKNHAVLYYVFGQISKLLHPYSPFVTEQLWGVLGNQNLIIEPWPKSEKSQLKPTIDKEFSLMQNIVSTLRHARQTYKLPAGDILDVSSSDTIIKKQSKVIEKLALVNINNNSTDNQLALSSGSIKLQIQLTAQQVNQLISPANQSKMKNVFMTKQVYVNKLRSEITQLEENPNVPLEVIGQKHERLRQAEEELSETKTALDNIHHLSHHVQKS